MLRFVSLGENVWFGLSGHTLYLLEGKFNKLYNLWLEFNVNGLFLYFISFHGSTNKSVQV